MAMNQTHEVSVKCIPFDGTPDNFRAWKLKALAYAGVKGFEIALVKDLGTLITQEQYLASQLDGITTTATTTVATAMTATMAVTGGGSSTSVSKLQQ